MRRPKTKKKRQASAPRTAAQYQTLPEKSKDTLDRAYRVLSKLRNDKTSLKKASREVGISPVTAKRWVGSALKKSDSGRYVPKASDNLVRMLRVPDEGGMRDVAVKGAREATFIAKYWNALDRYIKTGDSSELEKFRGKSIKDAKGNEISLPTDRAQLRTLGRAGVLSFENLYSHSA
jgi:hypothetical protein